MFRCRPGVVKTLEEFKLSVYGENYEEEEAGKGKPREASKKRKAVSESAAQKCKEYDWTDLADNGKVKQLYIFLPICLVIFFARREGGEVHKSITSKIIQCGRHYNASEISAT